MNMNASPATAQRLARLLVVDDDLDTCANLSDILSDIPKRERGRTLPMTVNVKSMTCEAFALADASGYLMKPLLANFLTTDLFHASTRGRDSRYRCVGAVVAAGRGR